MSTTKSSLVQLGEIITNAIHVIDAHGQASTNGKASTTEVAEATSLLTAAASQLIATVRDPALILMEAAMSFHLSSCLRVVIATNTVEIVRDAGPMGIHVREISKRNNTDAAKIARVLRLLSNHHIFREVTPDVFASNTLSSVLDCGKMVDELLADPLARHLSSQGAFSSLIEDVADQGFKSAGYFTEALTHPEKSHSNETTDSAFNIAFRTDKSLFAWFDLPENEYYRVRFLNAMVGTNETAPDALAGFRWSDIGPGGVVLDVGGGVGSSSMIIAKAFKDLRIVVQDRPEAVSAAQKYWLDNFPDAIEQGRVRLQEYDFFTPQPIQNPAVIFIRFVIHDWSDAYATKILQNQRSAAGPSTKLVVVDTIVPYTCKSSKHAEIPGASLPEYPTPLLPSLGAASNMSYYLDLQMANGNGRARTLDQFIDVAALAGWKVVKVHRIQGSFTGQYECDPM